jgi:hypothetical protein
MIFNRILINKGGDMQSVIRDGGFYEEIRSVWCRFAFFDEELRESQEYREFFSLVKRAVYKDRSFVLGKFADLK